MWAGDMSGRSFGEASYKLVEKFFGAYLEVEWVSTVLDTYIEELG
jgi:hypothetical protein